MSKEAVDTCSRADGHHRHDDRRIYRDGASRCAETRSLRGKRADLVTRSMAATRDCSRKLVMPASSIRTCLLDTASARAKTLGGGVV